MSTLELQNELDWTAFCYAAGELSPAEVEQFEARLAAEQPAREALARAVELTQAVAAAESQAEVTVAARPARRPAGWMSRLSWMAVGGIAAALIAALWSGAWNLNPGNRPGNLLTQRELAAAWSQARDEIASAKEEGQWPMVAAIAEEEPLATADLRDSTELDEAPSWMTAAVFGLAGKTLDDAAGPFTNERGDN
jgi:hypothetical protein